MKGQNKLRGNEIAVLSRTWEALALIDLALRQKKVKVADTKQPSVAEGPKAKPYLWALRLLVSADDDVSPGFDAAFEEVAL